MNIDDHTPNLNLLWGFHPILLSRGVCSVHKTKSPKNFSNKIKQIKFWFITESDRWLFPIKKKYFNKSMLIQAIDNGFYDHLFRHRLVSKTTRIKKIKSLNSTQKRFNTTHKLILESILRTLYPNQPSQPHAENTLNFRLKRKTKKVFSHIYIHTHIQCYPRYRTRTLYTKNFKFIVNLKIVETEILHVRAMISIWRYVQHWMTKKMKSE